MNSQRKKWIVSFAVVAVVVLLLRTVAVDSYIIPSSGMSPTLLEGDRVLVNKLAYNLRVPFSKLLSVEPIAIYDLKRGDISIFSNPYINEKTSDNHESIGRIMAVAGDSLVLDENLNVELYDKQKEETVRERYSIPSSVSDTLRTYLDTLGISCDYEQYNDSIVTIRLTNAEYHNLKFIGDTVLKFRNWENLDSDNRHIIVVPSKYKSVKVHDWNIGLIHSALTLYEDKKADIIDGTLYVDGKATGYCAFSQDYCWVVMDSPDCKDDSRVYGFIPRSSFTGKVSFVWLSKEKGSWFSGFRWNRFFKKVE